MRCSGIDHVQIRILEYSNEKSEVAKAHVDDDDDEHLCRRRGMVRRPIFSIYLTQRNEMIKKIPYSKT